MGPTSVRIGYKFAQLQRDLFFTARLLSFGKPISCHKFQNNGFAL